VPEERAPKSAESQESTEPSIVDEHVGQVRARASQFRPRRIGSVPVPSAPLPVRVGGIYRCTQSSLVFGSNSNVAKPFRPVLVVSTKVAGGRVAVLPATSSDRSGPPQFVVLRAAGVDVIAGIFWVPPHPDRDNCALRAAIEYVNVCDLTASSSLYASIEGQAFEVVRSRAATDGAIDPGRSPQATRDAAKP